MTAGCNIQWWTPEEDVRLRRLAEEGRAAAVIAERLLEMIKTMDLNAIAKKTGRTPAGILKTALRLGISIK